MTTGGKVLVLVAAGLTLLAGVFLLLPVGPDCGTVLARPTDFADSCAKLGFYTGRVIVIGVLLGMAAVLGLDAALFAKPRRQPREPTATGPQ